MTTEQIKYILTQNGYSTNDVMLDLSKFSVIFLDQDVNLYPDIKRVRYHFDFNNKILEIYEGKMKNSKFVYFLEDRPNHLISFDDIAGFLQYPVINSTGQLLYRN